MVSGVDVILFRPDEEVKRLARLAVELDVASAFKGSRKPEQSLAELGQSANGRKWLEEFEKAKDPWFYLSSGTGFYHHHTAWINDLSIPFTALLGYIEKLERGESLDRPLNALREERERIASEYRELLPTEQDKATFDQLLTTARTVFPYVENHLFYVEHWFHTVFYGKIRDLAKIFVEHRFFEDTEDIFYLHRNEVREAIYDMSAAWAVGTPARGPSYWPPEIAKRKEILKNMREWSPPPALGVAPEVVTEPFTIMLWGVTSERVQDWLAPKADPDSITELRGFAASPGIAEGPARVIRAVDEIKDIQPGEILVCPITSPSWAPVFTRIKAAVTDVGGIMSHAAIVCREYGLPAIAGTAFGTKVIKTGQVIRVDGNNGTVTILR
jgi:pyruvate,water dikinase